MSHEPPCYDPQCTDCTPARNAGMREARRRSALRLAVERVLAANDGRSLDDPEDRAAVLRAVMEVVP